MEHAKEMPETIEIPITNIAFHLLIQEHSYFCNGFKKEVITPSEYRNKSQLEYI
jgi:AraC-like DNA-binding protein